MMQLSMKTYVVLLWGMSVLFFTDYTHASIHETSSINSTAAPDKTTWQPISTHAVHKETEMQPVIGHPTHKPAEVSVTATFSTAGAQETTATHRSDSSDDSTTVLVAMTTAAAATNSSGPRSPDIYTAATTAAGGAQPSHNTTISGTAKPTQDQQSPTTSTHMTTSPAASLATETVSLPQTASNTDPEVTSMTRSSAVPTETVPQATSTTKPEVTSSLSFTTSVADSTHTQVFIRDLSSPSASTTTTLTANCTSEAVSDSTTRDTSINSTELSSTSQTITVTRTHTSTSEVTDTAQSASTAEPPNISTISANSTNTSSPGIFIPHDPKTIPTTKATTITPLEVSPSTEGQPCSPRGVIKHCLITIASLAGLATIFIITTIILCTKLSAKKYKVKRSQPATEMMCISSLLPETTYTYTRQRNPVTNGILVMHHSGDSDEDGGDNLTLSSFLPDNDRYV